MAPDLEDPEADDDEPVIEADDDIDDDVLEIVPGHDKEAT